MPKSAHQSESFTALAADGVFHRSVAGFTPRIAQQEMAQSVEDTLTHSGTLVVESGTGTGKTYAYLVPILLSGRRTIISTGTRHLQDQIFNRDLPQVARALGTPLNAVLLKGRANYLCRYRLKLHTQQSPLIGGSEPESYQKIEQWATATRSGDIAEVADISETAPLWKAVTSTSDNCLGRTCPDFKDCFVFKARKEAMQANLVVVNHHLFFAAQTRKAEGLGDLLPQHEAVVFDEAHSIAEVAADFFGIVISSAALADLGRDAQTAEKDEKSSVDFTPSLAQLAQAEKDLQRATKPFANESVGFEELQNAKFDAACQGLTLALAKFEAALATAAKAGEGLGRCHQRCLQIQGHFDAWQNGGDRNLIRWAQVGTKWFRFHGTPLDISKHFDGMMQQPQPTAWIFTSATLAVGDDFTAFCDRIGLHAAETRRWDSPYDFQRNALLYLPPDMPDPRERDYLEALVGVITEVLAASRGRAFCLFTSHQMMNRVYQRLCDQTPWRILLQGQAPKGELLERFAQPSQNAGQDAGQGDAQSILLGTASFWEGVDVKGERLSCVIIDKLPFAPPGEPVLKNRLLACEEAGHSGFMDIQVPTAVIALKQGAGRLIRSETDRGVLVLCDPRVVSKGYGRSFIASLPAMPTTNAVADVRAFFAQDARGLE